MMRRPATSSHQRAARPYLCLALGLAAAGCVVDASLARDSFDAAGGSSAWGGSGATESPDGTNAGAGGVGPDPQATSSCPESVPPLGAAPSIDGMVEPGLPLRPVNPRGWTGDVPLPAHVSAEYALAWLPSGLYAFVSVRGVEGTPAPLDQHPYCGDAVELFVDTDGLYENPPAYDAAGTMQFVAAAPGSDPSAHRGRRYRQTAVVSEWQATSFGTFRTGSGYVLEALVTAEDLDVPAWSLTAGGGVGVSLAIDVGATDDMTLPANACGSRLGQYFLHVPTGATETCSAPYCSTSAFCPASLAP